MTSDGEFVTGRWTMTGTNTGTMELFGIPPTGRPVTMTGQEIFRAAGGLFTEVWHQEDIGGMLSRSGWSRPRSSCAWPPGAAPGATAGTDAGPRHPQPTGPNRRPAGPALPLAKAPAPARHHNRTARSASIRDDPRRLKQRRKQRLGYVTSDRGLVTVG